MDHVQAGVHCHAWNVVEMATQPTRQHAPCTTCVHGSEGRLPWTICASVCFSLRVRPSACVHAEGHVETSVQAVRQRVPLPVIEDGGMKRELASIGSASLHLLAACQNCCPLSNH